MDPSLERKKPQISLHLNCMHYIYLNLLKCNIRVKFTHSKKTSNCTDKVTNKIFENIRIRFITFRNSLPLIFLYFIQCPRPRFRCDIFVVQPYPSTERYNSGQAIILISTYGDPDERYATVNCLLGTQLHYIMQLIRARAWTFAELGKINICGRYLQTNDMSSPKMSDCGSPLPNFTLLGCPGNESVSHFHRNLCFSLENDSRNAFVVVFFILELRELDPMLK
jgi:hypothetical protein